MAETPWTAEESVEAVIISGERKGELIRIPQGEYELTAAETALLDALVADAWRLAESARAAAAEADALLQELRHGRPKAFPMASPSTPAERCRARRD